MNATMIRNLAQATLSGSIPFPAIVGQLMAEGVEYYHVDYARLQFTFYDSARASSLFVERNSSTLKVGYSVFEAFASRITVFFVKVLSNRST